MAGPAAGTLTYQSGVAVTSRGVKQLKAYATSTGTDTALVYGSSGDDRFYGLEIYSIVYYGPGSTWQIYARSFETTTVDGGTTDAATGGATGGSDVSYLYDSTTDDHFVGGPSAARLTYQGGLAVESRRIKQLYAYATAGGNDTATLYGSSASDRFYGQELTSVAYYNGDLGWKNYLRSFDSVTIEGDTTDASTGGVLGPAAATSRIFTTAQGTTVLLRVHWRARSRTRAGRR